MRTRLRVLGATAAAMAVGFAVPLVTSSEAHAARFTGGDVVVYRVGDGTTPLTNAAAPVFLDEYGATGTPVQSIALPTAASEGNHALTASGESRSEGLIDRSSDGRFIALTGYDAAPTTLGPNGTSLAASSPTSVSRVVGLVDANGTVDTTTLLKSADSAKIIRSAATTDGDRLWATGGNGGIVTELRGASSAATVAGTATSNLNALTIQGGQLFTSGILTNRLASVGAGTPTSASLTDLSGLPSNLLTYGYAFADLTGAGYAGTALDTLYIADGSARGGTIDKYRYDGSTWHLADYVDVPGAFGVVADQQGNTVSLAVTTPTQLITFSDTNGSSTGFTHTTPTVLASAAANTEFRGVALAPEDSNAGPSLFVHSPGIGASVPLGGTVAVTSYVASPNGVASVQAKLGNGSYVAATKTSAHLWTAHVPTTGLGAGASTLSVQASDQSTPTAVTTTVTRPVTLTLPTDSLTAGTYPWTSKLVKVTGSWKTYRTKHSPTGKGRVSAKKKSTASTKVYGHGLTLTFDRSAKAGKVQVTVDGRSTTLDLFNKAGKPLVKTWSFTGGLQSHSVVVKVLGTKNTHSKGISVFLAALKVRA